MSNVPPPIPLPASKPQTGFHLRWYTVTLGIAALGLFLLAALVMPVPVEGANAYGVGYAVGRIVGSLACPTVAALLVGVIAYFASGKSTRVLNIAMSVTLLLFVLLGAISVVVSLLRNVTA